MPETICDECSTTIDFSEMWETKEHGTLCPNCYLDLGEPELVEDDEL